VYIVQSKYVEARRNFQKYLTKYPKDKNAKIWLNLCKTKIDTAKFKKNLPKFALESGPIGRLAKMYLCMIAYVRANDLWIMGVNETEYKDGENIVSSKIYEAQGHLEKIRDDFTKIKIEKSSLLKSLELFLFAVNKKIDGIKQHSEGFYKNKTEYMGEYEKGRAKIKIANGYFLEAVKILHVEIKKHSVRFGKPADDEVEEIIKFFSKKN